MEFLKSGLLVGILVIFENACGDVICNSGDSLFSEQRTCGYGQVCCGEMNTECCSDDKYRNEGGYAAFMMIVSFVLVPFGLLVLACCLVSCCCCWYFNRKNRRNNQGVVYSQAATVEGTVSFPPNKVLYIIQPNQNQAISNYGMSPVYQETTQMLSPAGNPYAPVNDQLKLVKSEA